jgi:hypothetical protein
VPSVATTEVATTEVVATEVAATEEVAAKPERKPRPPRRRKTEPSVASAPAPLPDLEESGLVMIETRSDITASPPPTPEPRKRKAQPAAWQNKASDADIGEPLVMVETQK